MSEIGFGTTSFLELRQKEVVNVLDGRKLGRMTDLVFCAGDRGEVRGIIVPFGKRGFFTRAQDIFIPWHCIRKIGEDVILVELIIDCAHAGHGHKRKRRYDGFEDGRFDGHGGVSGGGVHTHSVETNENEKKEVKEEDGYRSFARPQFDLAKQAVPKQKATQPQEELLCDKKCEKCMMFDCAHRWKGK